MLRVALALTLALSMIGTPALGSGSSGQAHSSGHTGSHSAGHAGAHSGSHSQGHSGSHASGQGTTHAGGVHGSGKSAAHSPASHGGPHAAAGVKRDADGKIHRSTEAKDEFKQAHHCPSTGKASGGCPGYVIDHVVPLKRGGRDAPSNMQWQTTAAAKAKDKTE